MRLSLSSVTAAAHSVSVGEFVDRALHSGADRVAGLPLGRLLLGADAELQVAEFSWGKAHGAGTVGGGCAAGTDGAGRHWLLVNRVTISGAAVGEEVG